MTDLDFFTLPLGSAGDIEQAAQIASREDFCPCGYGMVQFVAHHLAGNFRHLGAESAAKATTDITLFQLTHFDSTQVPQQLPWLSLNVQLAQSGAGIVVGNRGLLSPVPGLRLNVGDLGEESGELKSLGSQLQCPVTPLAL